MGLRGAECFRIDCLTFLKRYSFFVKTFIVWALFSIPWNITSFMILNSMKSIDETQVNYTQYYTCYENISEWESWVDAIELWLRGVIPSIISTLGIIFNVISFLVLRKCEGNEVFKQLLMSLGISKKINELQTQHHNDLETVDNKITLFYILNFLY